MALDPLTTATQGLLVTPLEIAVQGLLEPATPPPGGDVAQTTRFASNMGTFMNRRC